MESFYSTEELEQLGLKKYGTNVLISKKASLYGTESISIGNDVRIDDFCILSGKIELQNNIHIAAYSALFAGEKEIVMKDYTCLSSRCVIYAKTDDFSGEALTNPMIPDKYRKVTEGKVTLERHVLIGTGTTILPSVLIGEGTAVGSMSLVNRSLEPWGIYVGCPCKRIKERKRNLLEIEKRMMNEKGL